jgi:hypothetical protein
MQIIALNDTMDPSFLADEQTAINIYQSLYSTDYITVTINFGDGDINGTPLMDQNNAEAEVNLNGAQFLTYATLRSDLLKYGMGSPFFNAINLPPGGITLPDGSTPNFWVSSAVAKIFGLPTNVTVDGEVGIGTTGFTPGPERVAAFLHEIGHVLGRYPDNITNPLNNETYYSELDLWRFTSQGQRLFDGNDNKAPAAYFSLDGGVTDLADWGQTSDPTDFRGTDSNPPSNLTPNDPFNENVGNLSNLTNMDFAVMDALGFTTTVVVPPGPDPIVGDITVPHPKLKTEAAPNQRLAASSLFTATDLVSGGGGGHSVLANLAQGISSFANQTVAADRSSFKGTVAGLPGQHARDFADICLGANATLGYGGNKNSGATLGFGDGAQMANIALLGSYMGSTFAHASDGQGGALLCGATISSEQHPIAPALHH